MNGININIKMRFIGYYMSEDQFMRTEAIFPEKAQKLAEHFHITFDTILENRFVDDEMKAVFNGNTVFILKGENGKLYGYYPKYNIARLTNVRYIKPNVTPMPNHYKRWFYPGERFHLYKPEEQSSDIE